jgi:hypothetical protein
VVFPLVLPQPEIEAYFVHICVGTQSKHGSIMGRRLFRIDFGEGSEYGEIFGVGGRYWGWCKINGSNIGLMG